MKRERTIVDEINGSRVGGDSKWKAEQNKNPKRIEKKLERRQLLLRSARKE